MTSDLHKLLAEYPLEVLLQTIPTGLFLVNREMQVVYWNSAAERITGYSAAEAVGQHCSFLDGIPCGEKCGLYNAQIAKPVVGVLCSVRHRDGHRVELSKNVDLLRDGEGRIIGGIEAFVDVSQQKTLEQSLRQEVEERTRDLELEKASLHSVLDGMTDLAYICNTDGQIRFMNRAMREVFGDVCGQTCYKAFFSQDAPCEDCPIDEVLAGKIIHQEREVKATGRIYEVVHSPHPTINPTQKLAVFRDITRRKETEQRLQQANRELDAFVSTISHDLRSPLTPLIGYAELLRERFGVQLDQLGKECLDEIEITARKMKELLEDLLALAKVGQVKCPQKPINTTLVVEGITLELSKLIQEKQAKIEVGDLPKLRIPESLLADIFRNLMANALYYAADTDPLLEVGGEQTTDKVCFWVRDHGPGIDQEERKLVFEAFKRGSSSDGKDGTGIGLATVAKIARLYCGNAWVEETPSGGATFKVEFLLSPND